MGHRISEIVAELKSLGSPEDVAGMARFGITAKKIYGVRVPELRRLAKRIGRDHALAADLWKHNSRETRILAAMVDDPERVSPRQMDRWLGDFDSWEVCDQACMNLFDKIAHAWDKAVEWSSRECEFERRGAFALMACLAWHDKGAPDSRFVEFFPYISSAADDDRNFVKKAVNWALRQIGKRNRALNRKAIAEARHIEKLDSRSARWIASDALRELQSPEVQRRLKR